MSADIRARLAAILSIVVAALPSISQAREYTLDYQATLRLAAERAPAVLAARGRIDERRAQRAGAGLFLPSNPELDVAVGPRLQDGRTTTDFALGLGQSLEFGRRGARLALVDAGVGQAVTAAQDALRLARRDAALAYFRVRFADKRVELARLAEGAAADLLATTERRLAKGDAVALDVNLARSALGRARSATLALEAEREQALGELRALLALEPTDTLVVTGELKPGGIFDLPVLLAAASRRPDLRQLDAERDEGAALARLGRGQGWPDLRLGVTWSHEESADIVLGGVTIGLPLAQRGQEARRVGAAQIARAAEERLGRARAVDAEVRAAFAAYQKRLAAVEAFERDVLPLLDENDRLLARTYDAGQLAITDYLVARREILEARIEYLERLHELVQAATLLQAAAGVLS